MRYCSRSYAVDERHPLPRIFATHLLWLRRPNPTLSNSSRWDFNLFAPASHQQTKHVVSATLAAPVLSSSKTRPIGLNVAKLHHLAVTIVHVMAFATHQLLKDLLSDVAVNVIDYSHMGTKGNPTAPQPKNKMR